MEKCCGLRTRVEGGGYIPVPLTSVQVDARLVNFTCHVTVTQTYVNREENPVECEYFYPVEEEAAVVHFQATVEGRVLVSQVKEKEAARAEYQEAVDAGRTGFLLEETRPDILQISVGHLSPGAGCTISLSYIYEAPLEAGRTRVTVPTTISPKYIPFSDGTPEAKKIASIQYDFKTQAKLGFSLELCMKSRIDIVSSPSHEIVTEGGTEPSESGFYSSRTRFEGTTADMDRDIVVLVQCEDPNRSIVFVEETEQTKVMMVSLVPRLEPTTQPELDIVFLIDCSGSMGGSSINLAREAINILLHSLPPSVYFNIVLFGSTYNKVFKESRLYNNDSLKEAKNAMKTLDANLGGTEILAPLQHLLEEKTTVPRRIFVLTDGSVSNSSECIKVTRQNNVKNAVFTLGIGSGADRHLVKGLARAGRGTAQFTVEGEIMAPKVIKQLKNCMQPSYQDVKIDWGAGFGAENSCQAPSILPPIYDGSRIQIFRLFEAGSSLPAEITLSASLPSTKGTYTETVKVETAVMKDNLLHKMFARKMIQELEENYEEKEDGEVKVLVTELSLKYQLLSKYTSFVAVDTKEGKATGALVKRHIANQYPHGFGGGGLRMMSMSAAPSLMMRGAPMMMCAPMMCAPPPPPPGGRMMKKSNRREEVDSVESLECFPDQMLSECMTMELIDSPEEDDELKEQDPEKRRMEIVLKLISLQSAEGSFEECVSVYSWCELDQHQAEQLQAGLEQGVFFTLLVLLLLEERFKESRDCWDMVVEKGWSWIRQRSVPGRIQQQIKNLIKK